MEEQFYGFRRMAVPNPGGSQSGRLTPQRTQSDGKRRGV